MEDKFSFYFEGSVSTDDLDRKAFTDESEAVASLQKSSNEIVSEIKHELERRFGITADVDIQFNHGSIDWSGFVQFIWHGLENMATLGGAIAFAQLIGSAISHVLKKKVPANPNVRIFTRVTPISIPLQRSTTYWDRIILITIMISNTISLGILAFILYLLVHTLRTP